MEPLGYHQNFTHVRLIEAPRSDWLTFPLERDPLYLQGRFPVPRRVLRHLKAVDSAGAKFDYLYIAHELPKGLVRQGDALAVRRAIAPPSPKSVEDLSLRLGRISLGGLVAAIGTPLAAVAASGIALGAAAIAAGAALTRFDPVIFAGVSDGGAGDGTLGFCFVLASWTWEG